MIPEAAVMRIYSLNVTLKISGFWLATLLLLSKAVLWCILANLHLDLML